ncbi:hypothetical protein CP083_05825 [Candidatus Bathyarchaeota archaeon B24-2]|nr:MAG: hypothetical protein CP083_05825 [Candidatus Bathyarchaeota archaeon B24-2]
MESLKEEILELLEKDREFRYAVAGYLGLSEIMKKLDVLAEEQVKLREEQTKIWQEIRSLREEQTKLWEEVKGLREEQTKVWREIRSLREEQTKLWKEVKGLREGQTRLWEEVRGLREEQTKLWEEVRGLREEQTKLWKEVRGLREEQVSLRKEQTKIWEEVKGLREEQTRLREDFNKMLDEIRSIHLRLSRVERTLEKLTLDIEEEARSILSYRIQKDLGIRMKVDSLLLKDLELNLYGVSDDLCIVGEASVRAGVRVLNDLLEKIETLKRRYPEKLRKKIIPVIYTSLPMPDLIHEAKKQKVWVLKATEDIVKVQV